MPAAPVPRVGVELAKDWSIFRRRGRLDELPLPTRKTRLLVSFPPNSKRNYHVGRHPRPHHNTAGKTEKETHTHTHTHAHTHARTTTTTKNAKKKKTEEELKNNGNTHATHTLTHLHGEESTARTPKRQRQPASQPGRTLSKPSAS